MRTLRHIRRQHRAINATFDELEFTTQPDSRMWLILHLAEQLKTHEAVEQELVYPLLRERLPESAAELVAESMAAHAAADALLDEAVGAGGPPVLVHALRETVRMHIEQEEEDLLPLLDQLGERVLAQLDTQLGRYLAELGEAEDADADVAHT
jgi:iron-sulfur cluster repair protein YtfE (RIC family)